MEGDPKEFARALAPILARALHRNDGGGTAPPAAPPAKTGTGGPDEEPWWTKWIYGTDARLAAHDEALAAVDTICGAYEERIIRLEGQIAELQKKPAARTVEHVRDSNGSVIRSVVHDAG